VLYVQFWSEPDQAVCWEVSSGHRNRGARRFVTRQARRLLADMDFRVRGEARNFGKTATISNKADAAAVARDVLRILHDGFGYTGETALVAKTIASGRSEQAVVHTGLTPDDTVTLLRRLGCETELQKHEQGPVVFAQWEGFRFVATLAVADDAGVFRCLDLTAIVGQASNATMSAWAAEVNELNAASRVARAWPSSWAGRPPGRCTAHPSSSTPPGPRAPARCGLPGGPPPGCAPAGCPGCRRSHSGRRG
jgi:hypothetical protein